MFSHKEIKTPFYRIVIKTFKNVSGSDCLLTYYSLPSNLKGEEYYFSIEDIPVLETIIEQLKLAAADDKIQP